MKARTYRGEPSRPIPVWNGILEHVGTVGMAIWLYLWCLNRITFERDGVGYVLGGAPVKVEQIAGELGRSQRALRRDFAKLRTRYLRLRWTPYGYVIQVLNSRKFGIWKPESLTKNGKAQDKSGEAVTENGRAVTEFGRSKEDTVVAVEEAAAQLQPFASEKSVWVFLGIEPSGPASFRSLVESGWASRNRQVRSEIIGNAVDAWENTEGRKLDAPRLFHALGVLRTHEKRTPPATTRLEIVKAEIPA